MSRFILFAAVGSAALIFAGSARADRVVLVAGGGDKGDGAPATEARLHQPFGVDFDRSGAMFIVELEGGHVHRVDARGTFSTVAGTGEMKKRYGFIFVDKDNEGNGTLNRSKKKSFEWYQQVIASNGERL